MTPSNPQHTRDKPIEWSPTLLTKILRLLSNSSQYRIAEFLVNEANALRMASPLDGYVWADNRKSPWAKMKLTDKAIEINKAMSLEDTRKEQEQLNEIL